MSALDGRGVEPEKPEGAGLQRRTIVGAAAWAAPAIALSAATPAAAVSTQLGSILWSMGPASFSTWGAQYEILAYMTPRPGAPTTVDVTTSPAGILVTPPQVETTAGGGITLPISATPAESYRGNVTLTLSAVGYVPLVRTIPVDVSATAARIALTSLPGIISQGEQGTAQGKVTPPSGESLPATVSVSSTATDIATVPATVTVAGNGTFSIPVKAVAASGSTTISVTAPGYPPLAFSVTVTAAAPGTLTLTTTGVLNTLKGLPMLDESVEFTATVKSKSGTAMQGADVTVQAPSGTRFSSGAASMTGKTNSSGQYTVTLYRASASTPASTVTVAATSAGLTAGKDLIIVGPEVTVGWDQPQITECHYWDWKTAEGDWAQVWQKIPAAHTTGTTDSWVVAAGGVNAVATPGTWSKSEPNKALAWLTLANGGGGVELKKPVPAKKWQFTVRNYSGGPIALRALKLRYVGTAWTTDSTYSANI